MKNIAIVLAAGQGKRMGTKVQKQFLEIEGYPVLYYSLKVFEESNEIDEIILVTGQENIQYCRENIVEKYHFHKISKIVPGGKERYHSVHQGLLACENCAYVFIHDGARPFVDEEIIKRAYGQVQKSGACVVGMPVKDTIKIANEEGYVESTPSRDRVWMIQTPQVFQYILIKEAYEELIRCGIENVTDDAMVLETVAHYPVKLVEGSYRNIKITTPEDLKITENLLKK